jgi:hypothetical protein
MLCQGFSVKVRAKGGRADDKRYRKDANVRPRRDVALGERTPRGRKKHQASGGICRHAIIGE